MMRHTKAVFGKTKENHVIWKGIFDSGRTYFQSDPTETMKNHTLRPQSQRPMTDDVSFRMKTACSEAPMKSGGRISLAWFPSCTGKGLATYQIHHFEVKDKAETPTDSSHSKSTGSDGNELRCVSRSFSR